MNLEYRKIQKIQTHSQACNYGLTYSTWTWSCIAKPNMQVYEWYFVYLTPISVYFGTFWSLEVVRKIERALICPEVKYGHLV